MTENELYHYGIKGMKWGVRKSRSRTGSSRKKRSKTDGWSDDAKEAYRINKKKVNQMSNAELRKVNERRNLERNYKQLNPNAVKRGVAVAATTAAALGTMAALYNNGSNLIKIGQKIVEGMKKK